MLSIMSWRRVAIAVAFMVAAMLISWAGYTIYWHNKMESLLSRPLASDMQMRIPSGATLREIAKTASTLGAPLSAEEFIELARYLNIHSRLQAGVYHFAAGASAKTMLDDIVAGKVAPFERITIIEGTTYDDLRDKLRNDSRLQQKAEVMSEADLRIALNLHEADSFEGMFLPETYFFNLGDSDLDILQRARRGMQKTLQELWEERDDDLPFSTPEEALILASIIEKETGAALERTKIASVFVNRLRRGMPLQADPTVIYGLRHDFDGNLRRVHLRDKKNLYNTYVRRGLTPTPIALPGRAAIFAALNPAQTPYYYFVASGDGDHVFSRTLREHNNAVNKYQRRRRK